MNDHKADGNAKEISMNGKSILLMIILSSVGIFGVLYFFNIRSQQLISEPQITIQPTQPPLETVNPLLHPLITLSEPLQESKISSPVTISGEARGNWFFEATFPVVLTNWNGLIIAEGYATAQSDWMTEEFVPFTATLTFDKPDYGERGFLILQKANPSGLSEHDDALEITVFFE